MKYDGKTYTIQRTASGELVTFKVRIIREDYKGKVLIESLTDSPYIYGWVKFSELTEVT